MRTMLRSWLGWSLLALLLVALVSCSARQESPSRGAPGIAPMPAPAPSPAPRVPQTPPPAIALPEKGFRDDAALGGAPTASDRLVIRQASMDIVVEDFPKASDEISALAVRLGGFVVSSRITEMAPGAISSISIRVPASKLDEALQAIKALAKEVKTVNTNSQDITEEFTDLQARLKNLEAGEAQLVKIMAQAKTVDETLKVQRELTSIRGQIESVKGRIKYLQGNVEESLISVTMRLTPEARPVVEKGWRIGETLRSAARGFLTFGRVVLDILVWLVIFIPVWVAAGLVFLLVRKIRRSRKAAS